jgi:hypothetical protein
MTLKSFVGAVTAAAFLSTSAFAADIAPSAPLPAGKPAGAKEAALLGEYAPIYVAVAVAVFVALAASGTFNDDNATPNTQGFQGNNAGGSGH